MVRIIAALVGLAFAFVLTVSLVNDFSAYLSSPPEPTADEEFHKHPKHAGLQSDGIFGSFDEQQLQRGFQVYKEVCAACHGLSLVNFYDLAALGYEEPEIKAIANQWAIEVPTVNEETGEAATRPAITSDAFPSPYANEVAARAANNNALPPDLSLLVKAREGGADYVYSVLTGYQDPPAELLRRFPETRPGPGLYHNPYFHGLNIAMPPPITADGQVTYADGTAATVDQMAKDVTAFLVWAAEPKLERRHAAGVAVVIFLLIASIISYFAYRNIWATEKRKVRITGVLEPENIAKTRRATRKADVAG